MDRVIIGGGFSALSLLIKERFAVKVITPRLPAYSSNQFKINKFLSSNSSSLAKYLINNKNIMLHERTILGGHSAIWGGFINISDINPNIINKFHNYGIDFIPLSFKKTGSVSNLQEIAQIQFNDEILNSSKIIKPDIYKLVTRIEIKKDFLKIYYADNTFDTSKKIDLCVGVVQLIEIFINSGWIKEGDSISMEEYESKFTFNMFETKFDPNASCVIRYGFFRAINHAIGLQRKTMRDVPFMFVNQNFYAQKNKVVLRFNQGSFIGAVGNSFGKSIHYCNLKINDKKVNEFMSELSKNVKIHGAASISQSFPGPISNDIVNNIWQ